MASMRRLARTARAFRHVVSRITLTSPLYHHSPSPRLQSRLLHRMLEHHMHNYASEGQQTKSMPRIPALFSIPAILAGLFAVGQLEITYADANEATERTSLPPRSPSDHVGFEEFATKATDKTSLPPGPPSNHVDWAETARRVRHQLEDRLKIKGVQYGSYPRFTVAVKGQKVIIKFQVPPTCEIPYLIAELVSRFGVKLDNHGAGADLALRAWASAVAWELLLSRSEKQTGTNDQPNNTDAHEAELSILMFRSLISSDNLEIEFIKKGTFTSEELDTLVYLLQFAGQQKTLEKGPKADAARFPSTDKTVGGLESMGVKVYGLTEANIDYAQKDISWDTIAGYDQQKREIEDTILLALHSPEVYDDIARGTRCKFETNRPRAVLFEGPPGTGKTSCARVIAKHAGVPLLHVPLEAVMSKYYGESERLLGKVFSLANELPNGAIVFLDEIDSLGTARDGETHEATRRILSVLLRQIDGFEQDKKVVVVAATNRKQDLDPALISRFDSMIAFVLPDQQTREEIAALYAKHLSKSQLAEVAAATEEMSGRDIRDVCQQAERRWASKIIRGQALKDEEHGNLPPLQEYIDSAMNRQRALGGAGTSNGRNPRPLGKKPLFDFV